MHFQTVEAGQAVVRPRKVYGADARFGRRTTVTPVVFFGGALLIMIIGLVLRIWNLGEASLWTDEVLTAFRAQASFSDSLDSIIAAGNQTPGYYWTLRLFPTHTETLLRLPSVAWGVVGIALAMFVVRRYYHDRELALWVGALLAVNPFHVWLSRTARAYALVFFLSLVLTVLFLELLRGHRSRRVWVAFTLLTTAAFVTHYTLVALFAAEALVFVFAVRQQTRFFRQWIASQVVAAGPVLGWVYLSLHDPPAVKSHWIAVPSLRDVVVSLWNLALGYGGIAAWYLVPALVVVSVGLILGARYAIKSRWSDRTNFFWLCLIVGPLLPVYLMSRFLVSIYVDRYFMVFLPAVVLLVIVGWMRFAPRFWRLALGVVALTSLYLVVSAFADGSYRRADWREAADYVAGRVEAGDVILVERENTREAFARYYRVSDTFRSYDEDVTLTNVYMLSDMPDTSALEEQAKRVWVIYRNPNEDVHRLGLMPDFDPYDPDLSAMGEWLNARKSQVLEQRAFNGMKILLLIPDRASPVAAGH